MDRTDHGARGNGHHDPVGESSEAAPNPLLGNSLMVLATLMATGYVLIAKRLTDDINLLVTVLTLGRRAVFHSLADLFTA